MPLQQAGEKELLKDFPDTGCRFDDDEIELGFGGGVQGSAHDANDMTVDGHLLVCCCL